MRKHIFCNYAERLQSCHKQLTKFHKTKKREATRYSFSFVRPSHCPVNRTSNTEAHAVCICCTKSHSTFFKRSRKKSYGYNIPTRHLRCIVLDLQRKVAKFHEVKKQARKRYFIMYSIPIPLPKGASVQGNTLQI